jgi:hypothetical protein
LMIPATMSTSPIISRTFDHRARLSMPISPLTRSMSSDEGDVKARGGRASLRSPDPKVGGSDPFAGSKVFSRKARRSLFDFPPQRGYSLARKQQGLQAVNF